MKIFFIIFFCFFTFLLTAQEKQISKDSDLIEKLKANKIQLIVMRPGQTDHNIQHLMMSSESPGIYLTQEGISQVKQSITDLISTKVDSIYTSPMYRALQTAQICGQEFSVSYQKNIVEKKLREQFFGDYEGKTFDQYLSLFSNENELFTKGAPNGETGEQLFLRTQDFLWQIALNHSNQTLLIVTHEFNSAQISMCLNGNYSQIPKLGKVKIYNFTGEEEQ